MQTNLYVNRGILYLSVSPKMYNIHTIMIIDEMYNVHVAEKSALISARIVSLELIMIRDKSGQTNLPPPSLNLQLIF